MAMFSWARYLRSLVNPKAKTHRKTRRTRQTLHVEHLEDRLAPATFTWTGKGGTNNWNENQNWKDQFGNQVAPTGLASNHEDLVFGASVLSAQGGGGLGKMTTNNNIANAVFNSITISYFESNSISPSLRD